jgi:hypothetical protein
VYASSKSLEVARSGDHEFLIGYVKGSLTSALDALDHGFPCRDDIETALAMVNAYCPVEAGK